MPEAAEKITHKDEAASIITERENYIFNAPVAQITGFLNEKVNKARFTGNWEKIERLKEKYDDVPADIQREFREMLAKIEQFDAHLYQKFDAALAALRKQCMLTHDMGLGKTRIYLLAAILINKPVLIVALPRLIKLVWANELNKLGIKDWVILERPKASKGIIKKAAKGLRKTFLKIAKMDDKYTSDPNHPAKFKIISYNSLLPGHEKRDYVICPKCKQKHKQGKCPGLLLYIHLLLDARLKKTCDDYLDKYHKGEIAREKLESCLAKKLQGISYYHLSDCRQLAEGSMCPECGNKMINNEKVSLYCNKCGYAARTWVPPITRRLKGKVKNICFDESQAIKNRQSLRSRYATSLKAKYRFLLSGTPATTEVAVDLYHQLKWLISDKLMFPFTSLDDFKNSMRFVENLYEILDPYQIRRDTDDYGVSCDVKLPPVKERRFSIALSDEEMTNYIEAHNDINSWWNANNDSASTVDIMSKMWMLRRAASVPCVDNPDIQRSTKIEALKTQINSYLMQGRKILVGTEMLDVLDAIEKEIEGVQRIDGDVPPETADRIIQLFQDICPSCGIKMVEEFGKTICPCCEKKYDAPKVLVCSRHAVREGVTLNKASVVIFTDPSWTYADMWQFWKRAHRIGAGYDCLDVIYMEAAGTIEEEMYDTAEKRKVAIKKAINRKNVEHSEKFNIRDFAKTLFSLTYEAGVKRNLCKED